MESPNGFKFGTFVGHSQTDRRSKHGSERVNECVCVCVCVGVGVCVWVGVGGCLCGWVSIYIYIDRR